MIRAPSVKSLCQLKDVGTATAKLIRKVIKTETRYELLQIAAQATGRGIHQVRLDYINCSLNDIKAPVLDELLGTFGVECIWRDPDDREPLALYLNAGDTYASTLAYWHGRWQITTMGDIVEREGV
jgi:hypothetical protein